MSSLSVPPINNQPPSADGPQDSEPEKKLTPAQKAARTRAANKARREATVPATPARTGLVIRAPFHLSELTCVSKYFLKRLVEGEREQNKKASNNFLFRQFLFRQTALSVTLTCHFSLFVFHDFYQCLVQRGRWLVMNGIISSSSSGH